VSVPTIDRHFGTKAGLSYGLPLLAIVGHFVIGDDDRDFRSLRLYSDSGHPRCSSSSTAC
jgi:hypothetical protein